MAASRPARSPRWRTRAKGSWSAIASTRPRARSRPPTRERWWSTSVTHEVTSAAIAYEDAGEHAVKGKAEPLQLWRALRVVAGVGGSQRERWLEAPLVGRDADLRLLKELFHAALERRAARLVAVSGAAGVGKTRLLWEFDKYADGLADTVLWHSGRCLAYGDGIAYWALAEMVRQRLGIAEEAAVEDARAKLTSGLERWVTDPEDREFLEPRLGVLLGVAEPGLPRAELFAGWRLFFERLAEHLPVVLVFEDLQWADEGLLDFIEHVLDWSASSPIFMLTLARPDFAADRDGFPWPAGRRGATLLELDPLQDSAIGEILDGLVEGLPGQARERIVERAEGVPLYAIETVRTLASRGVFGEHDGTACAEWRARRPRRPGEPWGAARGEARRARARRARPREGDVRVRRDVRARLGARARRPRGRSARRRARLARAQAGAGIRAEPLSPDRGQYAFVQGMLRTVAYEMLSRRERKPRHRAAAEHLRRVFGNDGEDVAEVIAAHYLDAYRAARADPDAEELRVETITALHRAAHRAAAVGAPESAERSYRSRPSSSATSRSGRS